MSVIRRDKKLEELSPFDQKYAVTFEGYVQSFINPEMLLANKISEDSQIFENIKKAQSKRIKIFNAMENTDNPKALEKLDQEFTANEFYLQEQWGFEENIDYHKFWEAPKCTCPKFDNEDNYPSGYYSFDQKCPIHLHRFK
tara:strand:- start:20181 stop:20603 length:423 start_codon:yes stop_codon:yes gene_type:complete